MTKKTKKILIGILSLLLIYFGYKLYLNLTLVEKPGYYDFERSNIQEKIVNDKKVLTEKNLGITMQIPKDWEYEYKLTMGSFIASDPATNVKFLLRDFREWTKGCTIGLAVENDGIFGDNISIFEDEFNRMNYFKEGDQSYCDYHHCEVFDIRGNEVWKGVREFEETNFDGDIQHVFIAILDNKKRRIYRINSLLSTQVPECQEHLNDFINNLEIK